MKRSILAVTYILISGTMVFPFARAKESVQGKLTLVDFTREALANNPSITSAWRKWNGMHARIVQAKAWDDPRVGADFTAKRFVEMAPNSMADQMFTVEQVIPISGKNLSRGRVAAADALVAFENFRRQQLDVVNKLKAAYFQFLNSQNQLAINGRNLTSLQQIATGIRAKYQTGMETVPEILAAEIEVAKLEQERDDFERIRTEAQTQLNVLMNRPVTSPIGDLNAENPIALQFSEKDLTSLLLNFRPEVRIARAGIDVEKARLQLARREWIPDPAININEQRYNGAAQTVSQLGAGVSFSIPWVNPGKYSSAVHEAEENLGAANAELEVVKSESLGLLHDQLERIKTTRHHYELYSGKILPLAQQAFDTIQLNYETGKSSFADWIATQRSLRDVQAATNNMLTDYETAVTELEAIVGVELPAHPSKNLRQKNRELPSGTDWIKTG